MNECDLLELEFGLRKHMNFVLCDDVREKLRSNEIRNKEDGANFIINNVKKVSFVIKGKKVTLLTMKKGVLLVFL